MDSSTAPTWSPGPLPGTARIRDVRVADGQVSIGLEYPGRRTRVALVGITPDEGAARVDSERVGRAISVRIMVDGAMTACSLHGVHSAGPSMTTVSLASAVALLPSLHSAVVVVQHQTTSIDGSVA